jgi:hypothetical protein
MLDQSAGAGLASVDRADGWESSSLISGRNAAAPRRNTALWSDGLRRWSYLAVSLARAWEVIWWRR